MGRILAWLAEVWTFSHGAAAVTIVHPLSVLVKLVQQLHYHILINIVFKINLLIAGVEQSPSSDKSVSNQYLPLNSKNSLASVCAYCCVVTLAV